MWEGPAHLLFLCLLFTQPTSACHFLASANASHTRISPCIDTRGFANFDLIVGVAGGVAMASTESAQEDPAILLLPALFVASGVYGLVSVSRCRESKRPKPTAELPQAKEKIEPPKKPIRLPPIPVRPVDEPARVQEVKCSLAMANCPVGFQCVPTTSTGGDEGVCVDSREKEKDEPPGQVKPEILNKLPCSSGDTHKCPVGWDCRRDSPYSTKGYCVRNEEDLNAEEALGEQPAPWSPPAP